MRPIWTGAIGFGLVNIPVKLYPASQSRRLDFDMLRKKDNSPVGYLRVAKTTGEKVEMDEIVKGYEYKKGDYVILTDEDFKKIDVKKTETVEIVDFVDEKEVGAKYLEKPYFVEPGKNASKVYALLREALKKSGKVGIARYVFRSSEHLGIVKVEDDVIMLIQMRFAHELRKPEELTIPKDAEVSEKELKMALSLIDQLTGQFNIEKYKDTYSDKINQMIKDKVEGKKTITVEEEHAEPTHVEDLMEKLKDSLEKAKSESNSAKAGQFASA